MGMPRCGFHSRTVRSCRGMGEVFAALPWAAGGRQSVATRESGTMLCVRSGSSGHSSAQLHSGCSNLGLPPAKPAKLTLPQERQ